MNDLIFRFYKVKTNNYFEVSFDERLSFYDNFKLLNSIKEIDYKNLKIYDIKEECFLSNDVKLEDFNFPHYYELLLF